VTIRSGRCTNDIASGTQQLYYGDDDGCWAVGGGYTHPDGNLVSAGRLSWEDAPNYIEIPELNEVFSCFPYANDTSFCFPSSDDLGQSHQFSESLSIRNYV